MWFLLTSRLRTWLLLSVVVPLAAGLVRRVGQALEQRTGRTRLSRTLLKAADLGERARGNRRSRWRRRR